MNTLHLKYALEVEKTGSITQAAENLYMNQPNLSKAIRELEQSIGITIFKRTTKGVEPTAKGCEFLSYARSILAQVDKIERMGSSRTNDGCALRAYLPRSSYITEGLWRFMQRVSREYENKPIDIEFCEANASFAINSVATGESGIGIIRYNSGYEHYFSGYFEDHGLAARTVWEFDMMLLVSKNSRIAAMDSVAPKDLDGMIEVEHGDRSTIDLMFRDMHDAPGQSDPGRRHVFVRERSSQIEMISNIPECYMWASPANPKTAEKHGIVQKRFSGTGHSYKDVLIHKRGYKPSETELALIEDIEAACRAARG